jgi:CheY-like chemotaxis protein
LALAKGRITVKLLFVDDDADTVWTFKVLLELMGHQTSCATTAAEALALATCEVPDFIFLDILLGNEDGRNVCTALRAEPTLAHCKIIALTGFHLARIECSQLPFDGFLLKPVTTEILERLFQCQR